MAFLGRPGCALPTALRARPQGVGPTRHPPCRPAGMHVSDLLGVCSWLVCSVRPARSQEDLVNRPLTAQCPHGWRH